MSVFEQPFAFFDPSFYQTFYYSFDIRFAVIGRRREDGSFPIRI